MTPEFTKERDALRATNRQLAETNANLAARISELEASAARVNRYQADRESYWLEQQAKWIANHDQYAKSCEWHAGRAATAEARVAALETEAADWKYLATARRESLAEVEETCDGLVARLATQTTAPATNDDARAILHAMASEPTPLEAAVTAHTEHVAVSVGAFDDRLRFFGSVDEAVELVDALRSDARVSAAISQRHAPSTHVAVTVERLEPDDCGEPAARYVLRAASVGEQMYVTTDEAVALITALLADGAVHSAWLHGRGGR